MKPSNRSLQEVCAMLGACAAFTACAAAEDLSVEGVSPQNTSAEGVLPEDTVADSHFADGAFTEADPSGVVDTRSVVAEDVEPDSVIRPAQELVLAHQLEGSASASCEGGACRSGLQALYSNLSQQEVQEKIRESLPLRSQLEREVHLRGIHAATDAAIERSREMLSEGQGDAMTAVSVYFEDPPFDFARLRPLRSAARKGEFESVVAERQINLT